MDFVVAKGVVGLPVTVAILARDEHQGRAARAVARAQQIVLGRIETVDQARHQPLVVVAEVFDPLFQHIAHRRGPRHEVEEVRGGEHVVLAGAQVGTQPDLGVLPAEVVGGLHRQPVGLVVVQGLAELRPDPAEPGGVRPDQPLVPDAGDRVDGGPGHVQRPGADRLRAIGDEQHPACPADLAEGVEIDGVTGQRMDPGGAQQPRRRGDRRLQFVGLDHPLARLDEADPHPPLLQRQPGKNIGRKIPLHQQHLVAGPPRDPVGEQVQPIGRAVGENDVVGRRADQLPQRLAQPPRNLAEPLGGQVKRRHLPPDRLLRRPHRHPGQRSLMGAVQPNLAIERAEVGSVGTGHGVLDAADGRLLQARPEPRRSRVTPFGNA